MQLHVSFERKDTQKKRRQKNDAVRHDQREPHASSLWHPSFSLAEASGVGMGGGAGGGGGRAAGGGHAAGGGGGGEGGGLEGHQSRPFCKSGN